MIPALATLPAPDSAQAVGWIVLTFFGIMGGLYYTISVFRHLNGKSDKTKISPQPLQVIESHAFATKPELDALEVKLDEELGRERGARKQIHKEIAELQSMSAVLRKETEMQTRQLHQLDGKMDRVLERLPRP